MKKVVIKRLPGLRFKPDLVKVKKKILKEREQKNDR